MQSRAWALSQAEITIFRFLIFIYSNKHVLYTASVYRGLQGLCGEIRVRRFQIYGDCMYTRNPVNFDVNTLCGLLISTLDYDFFLKFPHNFWGDFRIPAIPIKCKCILQGTLCDTGIPHTFYRGKICSVDQLTPPKTHFISGLNS